MYTCMLWLFSKNVFSKWIPLPELKIFKISYLIFQKQQVNLNPLILIPTRTCIQVHYSICRPTVCTCMCACVFLFRINILKGSHAQLGGGQIHCWLPSELNGSELRVNGTIRGNESIMNCIYNRFIYILWGDKM